MPRFVEFPEQTLVIAKDQPEYLPIPAHVADDPQGTVTCCWEFSDDEIAKLMITRKLWHQVWTFRDKLQPQLLTLDKPPLTTPDAT